MATCAFALATQGFVASTNALSFSSSRCPRLSLSGRHVYASRLTPPELSSLSSRERELRRKVNLAVGVGVTGDMLHDALASGLFAAAAYALVSTFDLLTQRGVMGQKLSRKLVHVLSGLLFTTSWPFYSPSAGARYFASVVPFLNCVRLLIYGLSLVKDEGLINSLTREGNAEELLRGPLYYVLVLICSTIVFWRESPVGVIAVAMMCGGDGLADIVGRRLGYVKLPYNREKSWAGSIAMFLFGFLISTGMLWYFSSFGYYELNWTSTLSRVALVSLVATVVESLPDTRYVDDNISVPLVSMITAGLTFGF